MKELLRKDAGIKLLSLLFAIFFWFYVINTDNPFETTNVVVPLTVKNESYLRDKGLMLRNDAFKRSVTLIVRGRRDTLKALRVDDFSAYVDFSRVESANDTRLLVEGPFHTKKDITVEEILDQYIDIDIERILQKSIPVEVEIKGAPPQGYKIADMQISPSEFQLDGLESIVGQASVAKAVINIGSQPENIDVEKECTILDKNGAPISSLNKGMKVRISIKMGKSVNITPEVSGNPAMDYLVTSVEVNPSTLLLMGDIDILSKIDSVMTNPVDMEGKEAGGEFIVSVVLPDKTTLSQGMSSEVTVIIKIERLEIKSFRIANDEINLVDMDTTGKYSYEIVGEEYIVMIKGLKKNLDAVVIGSILPYIDVGGLGPGTHMLPLSVNLRGGLILADNKPVEVEVRIADIPTPSPTTEVVQSPLPSSDSPTTSPIPSQ